MIQEDIWNRSFTEGPCNHGNSTYANRIAWWLNRARNTSKEGQIDATWAQIKRIAKHSKYFLNRKSGGDGTVFTLNKDVRWGWESYKLNSMSKTFSALTRDSAASSIKYMSSLQPYLKTKTSQLTLFTRPGLSRQLFRAPHFYSSPQPSVPVKPHQSHATLFFIIRFLNVFDVSAGANRCL